MKIGATFLCFAMVLKNFSALNLPPSLSIPNGATHRKTGGLDVRSAAMRSTRPRPLLDEQDEYLRDATDIDAELKRPLSQRFVINYHAKQGHFARLSSSGGKVFAIDIPVNRIALGDVARLILRDGGVPLLDLVAVFLQTKLSVSKYLNFELVSTLGEVYISPSLQAIDFETVRTLRETPGSNLSGYLHSCGIDVNWHYDFICSHLNVVRLSLKHGQFWHITLIPNISGATDQEMIRQICLYYELQSRREQMGVTLTAQDIVNLKAVTGPETHALMDFLVAKFADSQVCAAVGIPPGRARSVVKRYDSLCERLVVERKEATLKVNGSFVISKGRGPLDHDAAVRYEMRRRSQAEGFLKNAALATRKGTGMLHDKDLIDLVLAITRETSGSLSKGKGGLTPSEYTMLGPAMDDYDIPGGRVDRLYAVARKAIASKFGTSISRSTFYELLSGPCNVKFCMVEHTLKSPVLSQHVCRSFLLSCRWLFALFPLDSAVVTFDQKQLIKAGSDGNVTKEFQIRTERQVTVDHGMSNDTLCSLALYVIWAMPAVDVDTAIAAWGSDFELFVNELERRGLYDRDLFSSVRPGVAAAACYIHGGKDISAEICERETAVRNARALDSFYLKYSPFLSNVHGDPVPFMLHICDNSKGAMDKNYCFALGIDFFILDRDVSMSASPAGLCSTDSPGEKAVGALSKRTSGGHLAFDELHSEGPDAAARASRQALVDRAHGATFAAGGGHVDVHVAEDLPFTFPWDVVEIETFLRLDDAGKLNFISIHEAEWDGISSLYRKVDRYQQGRGDYELFTKGFNMCIWRKLDGCGDVQPWRGERKFAEILDLFGSDRKPPASVPSESRPKSYMRLLERLRTFARYPNVPWDKYNPRILMDVAWKDGLKETYFRNGGKLPIEYISAMMNDFRVDERTVRHEVERLAHLEVGVRARADLDRLHNRTGVKVIVDRYVRTVSGKDKITIPVLKYVLTNHFKVKKSQQQSHRSDLVHALAKLIPEASRALTAQRTISAAFAAGASASAAPVTPTTSVFAAAFPAPPVPTFGDDTDTPEVMDVDVAQGAEEECGDAVCPGDELLEQAQASDAASTAHEEAAVALAHAIGDLNEGSRGDRAERSAAATVASEAALRRGERTRKPKQFFGSGPEELS